MTCQTRSSRKSHPPLQETEIPSYPFPKIAHDLSGHYPTTLSGNTYIVSLIDIYLSWPEVFCVANKSADNIVQRIFDGIFPRHGYRLQILPGNGTKNATSKRKKPSEN